MKTLTVDFFGTEHEVIQQATSKEKTNIPKFDSVLSTQVLSSETINLLGYVL